MRRSPDRPSWGQGFARSAGQSARPDLWPDAGFWVPALGPTGATLYDVSGRGRNGTFGAGAAAPTWVTGQHGSCLSFDGAGDYSQIADAAHLDFTNNLTLSVWFRPVAWDLTYNTLVKKDGNYILRRDSTSATGLCLVYWDGTNIRIIGTGDLPTVGDWHHVCGVVRNNDVQAIWLDGKAYGTPATRNTSQTRVLTNPLHIGGVSGGATEYFDGDVALVGIYSNALPASAIRDLAADPIAPLRLRRQVYYSVPSGVVVPYGAYVRMLEQHRGLGA